MAATLAQLDLLTHSLSLPWGGGLYLLDSPVWLVALPLIPLMLWLRRYRRTEVLVIPFVAQWHRSSLGSPSRWRNLLAGLGITLMILALARPQRVDDRHEVRNEGYDLILSIDLSTSMLAEDYERDNRRINRLQAIQPVIRAFIERRPNDRIGIVVFAGRAYTLAPLTLDHDWLGRQVDRLKIGAIEDGTAIGDGLGVALSRLAQAGKDDAAGRRLGAFVILLTDGANNRGAIEPLQAADIAANRRIPVYTIGAGREGWVPVPVGKREDGSTAYQAQYSQLDEGLLRELATKTGGAFFRADDMDTIEAAFARIDKAQKIEYQAQSRVLTTELFPWLAAPALCLLLLACVPARGASRRAPSPASP